MSNPLDEADRFSDFVFDDPDTHHDVFLRDDLEGSGEELSSAVSAAGDTAADPTEDERQATPGVPRTADLIVMRSAEASAETMADTLGSVPAAGTEIAAPVADTPVSVADSVVEIEPPAATPVDSYAPAGGALIGAIVTLTAVVSRLRRKAESIKAKALSTAAKVTAGSPMEPAPVAARKSAWPVLILGAGAGLAAAVVMTGSFTLPSLPSLPGSSATPTSATPSQARSNDPVDILTAELTLARSYATTNGTFTGYKPTAPVQGASGGEHLVLTVEIEGRCWSTGITPGYPENEIRFDPSGNRCNTQALAVIQAQLDNM